MWGDQPSVESAYSREVVRGPRSPALAYISLLAGLLSMAAGVVFIVALASVLNDAAKPYVGGRHGSGLQISPLEIVTIVFVVGGILVCGPLAVVCGCVSCVLHRSRQLWDRTPRRCSFFAILTGLSGWVMVGTGLFLLRTVLGPALAR
jgi:hypothetical protein